MLGDGHTREEVIEGIEDSIKKWEDIIRGKERDDGAENCPLCKMFLWSNPTKCFNCPVRQKVDDITCLKTPYIRWITVYGSGRNVNDFPVEDRKLAEEIAQEEVDFLREVLEDYKRGHLG